MSTANKYIPDKIRKKIVVLAACGSTVADIMKETGQDAPTISAVCMECGVRIVRKPQRITKEKRDMVIDLYGKGCTCSQITCETEVPVSTVRKIIRESNIMFPKVEEKREPQESEQPTQLSIEAESMTDKRREALRMLRDAIDMIIEAMTS